MASQTQHTILISPRDELAVAHHGIAHIRRVIIRSHGSPSDGCQILIGSTDELHAHAKSSGPHEINLIQLKKKQKKKQKKKKLSVEIKIYSSIALLHP